MKVGFPMRTRPIRIDVDLVLDQAEIPADARGKGKTARIMTRRAEQIAAHSIEFFNEVGAARVAINRLAASLDMSPGNFHYHFRTNNDLYKNLFDILNRDVRNILSNPKLPMTLQGVVQHQIDIQACLWRHRYFFRDMDYLINADKKIFFEYLHLQDWAVAQILNLQDFYQKNFKMLPVEDANSGLDVAQNCWMLWTSWIRWEAVANARVSPTPEQLNVIFHRLAWHHFSFHRPYMSQKVSIAIGRILRKKLLTPAKQEKR